MWLRRDYLLLHIEGCFVPYIRWLGLTPVCVCVCMYVFMCVCVCICVAVSRLFVATYKRLFCTIYTLAGTDTWVCVYVYIYVCIYVCVCVCDLTCGCVEIARGYIKKVVLYHIYDRRNWHLYMYIYIYIYVCIFVVCVFVCMHCVWIARGYI